MEFNALYIEIEKFIIGGGSLISPVGGENRQNIQLIDLTGNGTEDAVVFIYTEEENPIQILIFSMEHEQYILRHTISLPGDTLVSVDYADITGNGSLDIIIGSQLGDSLKSVSVYQLDNDGHDLLLRNDYSAYIIADLFDTGTPQLMVISHDAIEMTGLAQLYHWYGGEMRQPMSAPLSEQVSALRRLRVTRLSDSTPAVMVTGSMEGTNIVTDVFAVVNQTLLNVSRDMATAVSEETIRSSVLSVSDINHDGILDIPRSVPAIGYDGGIEHRLIAWQNYDSNGALTTVLTTYHNFADDWYIVIPDEWVSRLRISRRDANIRERQIRFGLICHDIPDLIIDVLSVYTLSGRGRNRLETDSGLIPVLTKTDTTIAVYTFDEEADIHGIRDSLFWIVRDWGNHDLM
jgi:hypothetical protein